MFESSNLGNVTFFGITSLVPLSIARMPEPHHPAGIPIVRRFHCWKWQMATVTYGSPAAGLTNQDRYELVIYSQDGPASGGAS